MKPQTSDAIDLDSYFQRIGYGGDRRPTLDTLRAIHQQHAQTIPFENLSPLLKQPVFLDLATLQQKLVHEGRGGYCFEQNLLLRSVLLALGFKVTNLAARVLWNLPEGTITPRSHMLLCVKIDKEPHIVDVGFGGITLTAPLALIPDIEQNTPHEQFRLIAANNTYTMQVMMAHVWKPLYYFDLQEQKLPDYEASNWYVSTHPNSLFVTNLIAARPDSDCRYALRNNQLRTHYLSGRTEQRSLSTVAELRAVLEDVFGVNLRAIANLDPALRQVIEQVIEQTQ
ncbi:MAG: arylamine N-acetyltransferase [Drouetiella hepatica Uher 2000/2452]|jgi:N-hydroxyarylamine O-acetyltransferase|uniref:Arylamine N-acetyltransferase n=1 Tax=Drouetiella hepatica Uher 2000/2452 TaxID=904376 RepID=A0A951QF00_9CYAN|nr:arylamine N-acetyltransferase [Drouetiella hepatica Uher 2000/2452]